ncbi:MAG: hypothetical protein RXO32_10545 [Thermoproteus sp.]
MARSERFDLYAPDGSLLGELRLYTEVTELGRRQWAKIDIYGGPLIGIYDALPLFLDVLAGRKPLKDFDSSLYWCAPSCRAEFVEVARAPWGAVMKIEAEMEGEVGTWRRLYEAVLPRRSVSRMERLVYGQAVGRA